MDEYCSHQSFIEIDFYKMKDGINGDCHKKLRSLTDQLSSNIKENMTEIQRQYLFHTDISNFDSNKQRINMFKRLFLKLYQLSLSSNPAYSVQIGKNYLNLVLFSSFNIIFSALIIYTTASIGLALASFMILSLKIISDMNTKNTNLYTKFSQEYLALIEKSTIFDQKSLPLTQENLAMTNSHNIPLTTTESESDLLSKSNLSIDTLGDTLGGTTDVESDPSRNSTPASSPSRPDNKASRPEEIPVEIKDKMLVWCRTEYGGYQRIEARLASIFRDNHKGIPGEKINTTELGEAGLEKIRKVCLSVKHPGHNNVEMNAQLYEIGSSF